MITEPIYEIHDDEGRLAVGTKADMLRAFDILTVEDGSMEFTDEELNRYFVMVTYGEIRLIKRKEESVPHFVFWSYDLFPYVLWNEIETIHDDGQITPKGYGGQMKLSKFSAKSELEGQKIIETLSLLSSQRKAFLKEFDDQAHSIKKSLKIKQ